MQSGTVSLYFGFSLFFLSPYYLTNQSIVCVIIYYLVFDDVEPREKNARDTNRATLDTKAVVNPSEKKQVKRLGDLLFRFRPVEQGGDIHVCMYVCMVITYNNIRVWINRVRLPILLVVS